MCITLYQLLHVYAFFAQHVPKLYYRLSAGNLIRESGNPANFNKEASEKYMKLSAQELKDPAENQPTKINPPKGSLEAKFYSKERSYSRKFKSLCVLATYNSCRSLHACMRSWMYYNFLYSIPYNYTGKPACMY